MEITLVERKLADRLGMEVEFVTDNSEGLLFATISEPEVEVLVKDHEVFTRPARVVDFRYQFDLDVE